MPGSKESNMKKKAPSVIAAFLHRFSKNKETFNNDIDKDADKSNLIACSTSEGSSCTVNLDEAGNTVEKSHRKGKLKKAVQKIKQFGREKKYVISEEKTQLKRSNSCNPVQNTNLWKKSTLSLCSLTSYRKAEGADESDIEELIPGSLDDNIVPNFVQMHKDVGKATSIDECSSQTALNTPFVVDERIDERYIELKPESLDDLDNIEPTFVEMDKDAHETTYIDECESQTALKTPFTTDENTGGVEPTPKPIIDVSNANPNGSKCGAMGSREGMEEVDPGHADREHGASCEFVILSIF